MRKTRPYWLFATVLFVATIGVLPAIGQGTGWQQVLSGTGNVWAIATRPGGVVFAATASGVYRSTDNGVTWTFVGFSPLSFGSVPSTVGINPANNEVFVGLSNCCPAPTGLPGPFGGGGSGFYFSTDNGTTWTYWNVGNAGGFGLDFTPSGSIIAASSGPGGPGGLFVSTNNGSSWTYRACCYPRSFANTTGGSVFAGDAYLGIGLIGPTPGGVLRSTDGGTSWTSVGLAMTSIDSIVATSANHLFAGSASSGIFRSTDGVTWGQVNGSLTNPVTSLAADSAGDVFAGVFGNGVYTSSDDGTTWIQGNSGLTDLSVESLAVNPSGYILAGTPSGVFKRSGFGICVLYDQTKSVMSGAVFPIKLALCDANGNDVSSSTIVVHATKVFAISGFSGAVETVGNANPDNDFRFDSALGTTGGYIFNLGTAGSAPGTYALQFTAGNDPFTHSVNFGVK